MTAHQGFGLLPRLTIGSVTVGIGSVALVLMLTPLLAMALLGEPGLAGLVADPAWIAAGLRTLLVAEAAVPIALLLGVLAALGLWGAPPTPRAIVLGMTLIPLLAPPTWTAEGLKLAADASGIKGVHLGALIAAHAAPAASVVVMVMCGFLNRLDPGLPRTALSAGAGPIQAWRLTVLPSLAAPVLVAGCAAFAATIGQTIADTVLAPRHHPTLGALLTPAIGASDIQATAAALILASLTLVPLCFLGCLALVSHPARA